MDFNNLPFDILLRSSIYFCLLKFNLSLNPNIEHGFFFNIIILYLTRYNASLDNP